VTRKVHLPKIVPCPRYAPRVTDSGEWRPVPAELDLPGSVYESRVGVTGAGTHPDTHVSWEYLAATLASDYTYFADVSQFQGVPVNNTYGHPILSFRICDGTYFDTLAERNWANARALLNDPGHPLSLVWVYFVFRPGTWDSVSSYIRRVFGSDKMPPNVAAMIDAEPWGGAVSGDHSYELNQWATNLAGRTASGWNSVVGYSYTAGFQELWPRFDPRIKRQTASYGVWDPSPYGWQYSGGTGTGGLPGWPHGAGPWPLCDMNVIKQPIGQILADFGYGDDMALSPEDKAWIQQAVKDGVAAVLADKNHPYVRTSCQEAIADATHPASYVAGIVDNELTNAIPEIAAAVWDAAPPSTPSGPAPDYEGTITLKPKTTP
jgi:hypothetical protein